MSKKRMLNNSSCEHNKLDLNAIISEQWHSEGRIFGGQKGCEPWKVPGS